jgi:hypothetical protein
MCRKRIEAGGLYPFVIERRGRLWWNGYTVVNDFGLRARVSDGLVDQMRKMVEKGYFGRVKICDYGALSNEIWNAAMRQREQILRANGEHLGRRW